MDNTTILLAAGAVVIVLAAAAVYASRRRSKALRSRYGAEYFAAVHETGDRRKAEAELREREKRVKGFDLRPLSPRETTDFSERWAQIQAQFVDDPGVAIGRADELLVEVMQARGYPAGDFEQRAADVSVRHPRLVTDYRLAHEVARRHAAGAAGTEEVRKALIHYRALFEDLLAPTPQDRPAGEARSFTSKEADDERTPELRDERIRRAADDRATRERGLRRDGDGATRL